MGVYAELPCRTLLGLEEVTINFSFLRENTLHADGRIHATASVFVGEFLFLMVGLDLDWFGASKREGETIDGGVGTRKNDCGGGRMGHREDLQDVRA